MLAHRIIPTILCRGRTLVKGVGFDAWRSVGLAAQAVRIHQVRGVDEVVLLDIAATKEGRGPDLELVEELADGCFMPLAVGGGVQTLDQVRTLLRAGADKIVIGTGVLAKDRFRAICDAVGSQAVVVSLDVVHGQCAVRCGKEVFCDSVPADWATTIEGLGAGEIMLQCVERDGTMLGYDLEIIRSVSQAVGIPVVASGGCSGYEDMRQALEAGASAVAAGALFQFTDATPRGAAQYLAGHGVEVRL